MVLTRFWIFYVKKVIPYTKSPQLVADKISTLDATMSDVCGVRHVVPQVTIGASMGCVVGGIGNRLDKAAFRH